jgi:two-component system chemotaxis response regulator CheY
MILEAKATNIGCQCEVVESGARALEVLDTFKPDIILTDLWMPEMNGDQLAENIRKLPNYQELPIFVVTADSDDSTEFNFSVFTGMIQKPIDDQRLKEILAPE